MDLGVGAAAHNLNERFYVHYHSSKQASEGREVRSISLSRKQWVKQVKPFAPSHMERKRWY